MESSAAGHSPSSASQRSVLPCSSGVVVSSRSSASRPSTWPNRHNPPGSGARSIAAGAGDRRRRRRPVQQQRPGRALHRLAAREKPPSGQGTPGLQVEIQTPTATLAADTTPAPVAAPGPAPAIATTIRPTVEAAAQSAAGIYPRSAMVVLQPSTGDILAIANHDGLNHTALTGRVAPGSTFKVITSAALFNRGALTPNQIVPCPATENV